MNIQPIKSPIMKLLHTNISANLKPVTKQITETYMPVEVSKNIATYKFLNLESSKVLELVIDKTKMLISRLGIFSTKDGSCTENAIFDYNKKGQIIRSIKNSVSPTGKENTIRTNIKYQNDNITITKDVNNGHKTIKTFFSDIDGKRNVELCITKPDVGIEEKISYKEGKKLEGIITKNDEVRMTAYGDVETGQMVFSHNTLSPNANCVCFEMLENGDYHKQLFFDNYETVVTRTVARSVSDYFTHNNKDLMTPQDEIISKLSEFLK